MMIKNILCLRVVLAGICFAGCTSEKELRKEIREELEFQMQMDQLDLDMHVLLVQQGKIEKKYTADFIRHSMILTSLYVLAIKYQEEGLYYEEICRKAFCLYGLSTSDDFRKINWLCPRGDENPLVLDEEAIQMVIQMLLKYEESLFVEPEPKVPDLE